MERWLRDDQTIPLGKHYMCFFVVSRPPALEILAKGLAGGGVGVSFLRPVPVQLPEGYEAFGCWIEPVGIDVTPDSLKQQVNAAVFLVSSESSSVVVDLGLDYLDWFHQTEAWNDELLTDDVVLQPGNWHETFVRWAGPGLGNDAVKAKLAEVGVDVLFLPSEPFETDHDIRVFLVSSDLGATPTNMRTALGAELVSVTASPVAGDVLNALEYFQSSDDFTDKLRGLTNDFQNHLEEFLAMLSSLLEVGNVLFTVLKVAAWSALGLGVAYGAHWAYSKAQERYQESRGA